jgi:hypothetical protein
MDSRHQRRSGDHRQVMSRSPENPSQTPSNRNSWIEITAAISTILALFVALIAWLYPRSPGPDARDEASKNSATAQPRTSSSPAPGRPDPTAISSTGPPSAANDIPLAYGRTELTINCGAGVDIDLDEPRVLPTAGKDLTYLCIDQDFSLSTGVTGGYLNSATPTELGACLKALRSSAFNGTTTRVSVGLSFCVATSDQAHNTGNIVHVEALTDGWSGHVTIAVIAWRKPAARN